MADYIFTAPGRTEIGGNHTDHQHGMVIAGAINLETRAEVTMNNSDIINIASEGYPVSTININYLDYREEEIGETTSLIRGICARFKELGVNLCGFDAKVTSTVLPGSGLSSSAAFEVLIGTILNHICADDRFTAVEIAQIGQWAENNYFGKPCGLMDQMASSVGNIIFIDFKDTEHPIVEKIDFDFASSGHSLCIIDSGADHADLTDEYAAIPGELKKVCSVFGKNYLREIDEDEFFSRIKEVRQIAGDRAVLRAIHVYNENKRVLREAAALKANDFNEFLKVVEESGVSSYTLLQNVTVRGSDVHQEVAFAIALARKLLGGKGAVRVHGGGFAGTIQAFVPNDMLDNFKKGIEAVLGEGSCHVLSIRKEGGTWA